MIGHSICFAYHYSEKEKVRMASEMLKAVLAAEQECSQKEAEARQKAEADQAEAKKNAAERVAQARQQAENILQDHEKTLAAEAEARRKQGIAETMAQCQELSACAERNRSRVAKLVVEMLTRV